MWLSVKEVGLALMLPLWKGHESERTASIYPGAVISANPQDLKYQGEETTTHIGDNTTIRECVTINKGTADRMKTVVGGELPHYGILTHRTRLHRGGIIASFQTALH
ncbi:hypothetical protein QIU18_02000 [Capnocytophaga canimorsus]|nr:hypothetical protein [Capnocytophaga canimorsus]WGU70867.1 hypothetical protein QIU18_02000 [Capnocytophaga canimorsus]